MPTTDTVNNRRPSSLYRHDAGRRTQRTNRCLHLPPGEWRCNVLAASACHQPCRQAKKAPTTEPDTQTVDQRHVAPVPSRENSAGQPQAAQQNGRCTLRTVHKTLGTAQTGTGQAMGDLRPRHSSHRENGTTGKPKEQHYITAKPARTLQYSGQLSTWVAACDVIYWPNST